MGLRDVESKLPPGFRFYPSDEELVCHYLYHKVSNNKEMRTGRRVLSPSEGTMVEVDLHTREPWELPEVAKLSPNEWYFFSFRDRKYSTGSRTNRATKSGYWKATGKDRTVREPKTNAIAGMRKTLVFYRGRAPNGIKTGWVMHEFRLENPHMPPKEDWVLCRVLHKKKGASMGFGLQELNDDQQDQYYYDNTTSTAAAAAAESPNMDIILNSSYPPPPTMIEPQLLYHRHHDHQQLFATSSSSFSTFPSAVQQQQQQDSSANAFMNFAALVEYNDNILDFPTHCTQQGQGIGVGTDNSSETGDDQYGFLLDMGLQGEGGHVDDVPADDRDHVGIHVPTLEEMTFLDHRCYF